MGVFTRLVFVMLRGELTLYARHLSCLVNEMSGFSLTISHLTLIVAVLWLALLLNQAFRRIFQIRK